jgi:hypothetical protein
MRASIDQIIDTCEDYAHKIERSLQANFNMTPAQYNRHKNILGYEAFNFVLHTYHFSVVVVPLSALITHDLDSIKIEVSSIDYPVINLAVLGWEFPLEILPEALRSTLRTLVDVKTSTRTSYNS